MYGMVWHVFHNVSDIPVHTDRTVRHMCCHLWLQFGTIERVKFSESCATWIKNGCLKKASYFCCVEAPSELKNGINYH